MKRSIMALAVAGAMRAPFRNGDIELRPFWGGITTCTFDNSAESTHFRNGGEPWKQSGKRKMGFRK